MKIINRDELIERVSLALIDCNINLSSDVCSRIESMANTENNERAKSILDQIIDNHSISKKTNLPLCQDTGIVLMFIKLGNQVRLNFDLYSALNEAIARAYDEGNLRKSVVVDPLYRVNSNDNTPGVFHVELSNDDTFEILVAPKGAGSENMSQIKMFNPQTPIEEIEDYIYGCVFASGGRPCPPVVVGVGIGGTFEKAAINSKRAVLDTIGNFNEKPEYEEMERRLIERLNSSNIGPMGLGGKSTCMDVSIIEHASHIASLPVAVNIQCHVARHKVVKF